MAWDKPFNLFVYGTLMNPSVFRAVLGLRLVSIAAEADGRETVWTRDAVLPGHKKISPDSTYMYAVPDPMGRIRGYLVGPLPPECMESLRNYEGRNYSRRTLRVQTADGREQAVVFLANIKQLEHSFGYAFHDPFKQEVLLAEKIEAALLETEREQLHTTEPTARRAVGELHGDTIRDIVRRHFEAGGISDYAIRRSLKEVPLRDFARVADEAEAAAVAPNYLALVIRQVVFNQIEDRIHQDFRYEFDHMAPGQRFYERTLSCLTTLRVLNGATGLLDLLADDCLAELRFPTSRLVDYVRWAITAADAIYDQPVAEREVRLIGSHMGRGYVPFGAELEFSNIGHGVIRDPGGKSIRDNQYDGFIYFNDFGLDVLTWKLGGHVDDHHDKISVLPRRGFFEIAMGSLSVGANISKPVTDDPWVLNQLIHQASAFYPVAPHSVHISLQMRARRHPNENRLMPIEVMKCLLAVAGDPVRGEDGAVQIKRLVTDETITRGETPSMMFSQVSLRRSSDLEEAAGLAVAPPRSGGKYVQQFKFLRLSPRINYEPLAMALMGLQHSLAPGTFMTPEQYRSNPRHRKAFHDLLDWGARPEPISASDLELFLGYVHDGLASASRKRSGRRDAYISWSLSQLRGMIGQFNDLLSGAKTPASPGRSR